MEQEWIEGMESGWDKEVIGNWRREGLILRGQPELARLQCPRTSEHLIIVINKFIFPDEVA